MAKFICHTTRPSFLLKWTGTRFTGTWRMTAPWCYITKMNKVLEKTSAQRLSGWMQGRMWRHTTSILKVGGAWVVKDGDFLSSYYSNKATCMVCICCCFVIDWLQFFVSFLSLPSFLSSRSSFYALLMPSLLHGVLLPPSPLHTDITHTHTSSSPDVLWFYSHQLFSFFSSLFLHKHFLH